MLPSLKLKHQPSLSNSLPVFLIVYLIVPHYHSAGEKTAHNAPALCRTFGRSQDTPGYSVMCSFRSLSLKIFIWHPGRSFDYRNALPHHG